MRRLLRGLARPSTFMPVVFLLLAGFGVAAQFVAQNTLAILINGLFIAVFVMIVAAYAPTLLRTLRAAEVQKDQYLVSGILLLWGSIAASRMWSLALIMAGKPAWMINHWFQTLCYLMAAMSGFYFLQIPGASRVGYRYTTAAIIIAIAVVTVVLAFFEI